MSLKALIADDSRDVQLIVSAVLRKRGYDVVRASDGEEAWDLLQKEPIRLVISDWMMPRLDGTQLSRRIRAAGFPYYTYTILLTARAEREDFVTGMDAGADDFLTKPLDIEELRVRLRVAERILSLESALAERNRGLQEANVSLGQAYIRIREDVEAASRMQRSLLPQTVSTLGGVQFDWLFHPSSFVAGDMFNFFQLDKVHLAFYLLDVAGHGVRSAMHSVMLYKLLSPQPGEDGLVRRTDGYGSATRPSSPVEVVAELNRRFAYDPTSMMYFTIVYGLIETSTGTVTICQAGHPPPIYLGRGRAATFLGDGGFPVGLLPDPEYESSQITLRSGERLFIYSDGVTDCVDTDGQAFSDLRLAGVVEEERSSPLRGCLSSLEDKLRHWNGAGDFQDDVSLLALEIL